MFCFVWQTKSGDCTLYAIYADYVSDCGSFDFKRCYLDDLYIKANNVKIWGTVSVNNCNFKGVYNSDKCRAFTKIFGNGFYTQDSNKWPGFNDKLLFAIPSASDFTDATVGVITHWGGDGSKYTLIFEVKKGGGSSMSLINNLVENYEKGTKSTGNSCLDWNIMIIVSTLTGLELLAQIQAIFFCPPSLAEYLQKCPYDSITVIY